VEGPWKSWYGVSLRPARKALLEVGSKKTLVRPFSLYLALAVVGVFPRYLRWA
jgi:hypothetical protein